MFCDLIFFKLFFFFISRDALQSVVTALYCKLLIILGLAFPMAEVISESVPKGYYQLFYVYLFLGSLVFLLFTYVDLWRTKANWRALSDKLKRNNNPNLSSSSGTSRNEADFVDGISKLPRPRVHYGSFYLRFGAVCKYFHKWFVLYIQIQPK